MWVSQLYQKISFLLPSYPSYAQRSFFYSTFVFFTSLLLLLPGCETSRAPESTTQESPSSFLVPSAPIQEEKLLLEEMPTRLSSSQEPSVFKPSRPPFTVAFLVPFSGEYAAVGQALWEGAEVGYFEAQNDHLALLPRDTKGSPEGAQEALTKLLQENNIDLILGPLTATEVKAITPLAWEKGIPILSFSNMPEVAGNNVFIMGFSPENQMQTILSFALSQKIENFTLIMPASEYGKLIQTIVHHYLYTIPRVSLKETITYPANGADISEKIAGLRLSNTEALIIPEGGKHLQKILMELNKNATYKISKPKLIGSGQWDDKTLFPNPLLQGGWFPGTLSIERQGFEHAYHQAYGVTPIKLAGVGYDAIKVAIECAESGGSIIETITRSQGFQGAEGLFSFTLAGLIQRQWGVYEIDTTVDTKVRLLSPAS